MQNNKTNRNNQTRYVAMGVIMALVFSVFGWRLYDLQIANQETYAAQAEENPDPYRIPGQNSGSQRGSAGL